MAVAFDNASTLASAFGATTVSTPNFTISGANRAGAVGITFQATGGTVSSVTLGGVAGTVVAGTDTASVNSIRSLIYAVIAPPTGSQLATVNWTPAATCEMGAITATGVDQTTPINNGTNTAPAGSGNPGALSVTSVSGDLTTSVSGETDTTTTPATNQTLQYGGVQANPDAAGGDTGPGTGTTSHTWTGSTFSFWAVSGANFKSAAAAQIPVKPFPFANPIGAQNPRVDVYGRPIELIGKDQFFGAPGQGANQPNQPNPIPKQFPSDLRTLIDDLKLNLAGKDQFFGGPGQGPVYDYPNPLIPRRAIDLLTWLQSINLTALGFNQIPTNQLDWPNPIPRDPFPNALRTFIFYYIQSQGNPQFPPDIPNPAQPKRSIDVLTWLQSGPGLFGPAPQIPPFPLDYPNPRRAGSPIDNLSWISYFSNGGAPFGNFDYPLPIYPKRADLYATWSNLLTSTLFGPIPLNQYDWPNPKGALYPRDLLTFLNSLELLLIGQDALPFRQRDWPLPLPPLPGPDRTVAVNLSQTTLAPIIIPGQGFYENWQIVVIQGVTQC